MAAFHLYTAYAIVPTQSCGRCTSPSCCSSRSCVPGGQALSPSVMWWDWLAAALAIAIVVYAIQGGDDFTDRNTSPLPWDIVFGVA
jgi:TRAP-type uncharacterized transport system fused permease subunit